MDNALHSRTISILWLMVVWFSCQIWRKPKRTPEEKRKKKIVTKDSNFRFRFGLGYHCFWCQLRILKLYACFGDRTRYRDTGNRVARLMQLIVVSDERRWNIACACLFWAMNANRYCFRFANHQYSGQFKYNESIKSPTQSGQNACCCSRYVCHLLFSRPLFEYYTVIIIMPFKYFPSIECHSFVFGFVSIIKIIKEIIIIMIIMCFSNPHVPGMPLTLNRVKW